MIEQKNYANDTIGRYLCVTDAASTVLKSCFHVASERADEIEVAPDVEAVFDYILDQLAAAGSFIQSDMSVNMDWSYHNLTSWARDFELALDRKESFEKRSPENLIEVYKFLAWKDHQEAQVFPAPGV